MTDMLLAALIDTLAPLIFLAAIALAGRYGGRFAAPLVSLLMDLVSSRMMHDAARRAADKAIGALTDHDPDAMRAARPQTVESARMYLLVTMRDTLGRFGLLDGSTEALAKLDAVIEPHLVRAEREAERTVRFRRPSAVTIANADARDDGLGAAGDGAFPAPPPAGA